MHLPYGARPKLGAGQRPFQRGRQHRVGDIEPMQQFLDSPSHVEHCALQGGVERLVPAGVEPAGRHRVAADREAPDALRQICQSQGLIVLKRNEPGA